MTTRYFKATDGKETFFRSSKTKVYVCGARTADNNISFSTTAKPGFHAAEEITKAEFNALQASKVERVRCSGLPIAWANSPWQSWVSNASLMGG